MQATLLIELLTEELPPKALSRLGQAFSTSIVDDLVKLGFTTRDAAVTTYASPRRLAVQVANVLALQPDQAIERKGPAVASGFKDGQPTPALAGFARSCGVSPEQLEKGHDGKQDVFVFRSVKQGEPLANLLSGVVESALKKLPIPKVMRWGDTDHQFVRPVHGLIQLHGSDVVPGSVLGLTAGQTTLGHRFLSQGEIRIQSADSYAGQLQTEGKVVASFEARKSTIRQGLDAASARLNAKIAADEALLDEVTALVEWPVVLEAGFEADFLKVPQECLILTMQQNQKYFPLLDNAGKLINRFLLVSNLETADPSHIIHGNERVLRARLSDAKFFFEQDQKHRLDSRVPRLENVVYHNKIGSQLERVARLETLAGQIAGLLGADTAIASRAAHLAKADLLSDMVGEFPELQGIMGQYYARLDGEHEAVAEAIEGHYHPRFAGDSLPVGPIATAVALADKLETLTGIWGIGLVPTGDKDPFGLRRCALGVLRMMVEGRLPLDIRDVLSRAAAAFPAGVVAEGTVDALVDFAFDRLKNLLSAQYPAADIDAVLALRPTRFDDLLARLDAVARFKILPEAAALAAANKRIRNILKKVDGELPAFDAARCQEAAETALHQAVQAVKPDADARFDQGDFAAALSLLAGLKAPVDAFFDGVMVMAEDMAVRNNRLALLASLATLLNRVADISLLAE